MGAAAPTVAEQLVRFAVDLSLDAVPVPVREAARWHFLDALGVGLAASSLPSTTKLTAGVRHLGAAPESTAFGFAQPLPAASAALVNGICIHALEFDDTHTGSVVHGSAVVAPAALAAAERVHASGAELLKAIVAGWEVFIRLGLAAPGRFQERGFQVTAVGGVFAAALISSLLHRLPVEQAVHALGIAGSQASGVFEYLAEGATVKALHPGWAAHGGIVASYLAQAGMTGPRSIFEGRFGLYRTYAGDGEAGERLRALAATLGEEWLLPQATYKFYPCCHYIHPFLELAERLRAEGVAPAAIEGITCRVPEEEVPIICEPWTRKQRPASGYEARFSLPYCLAVVLLEGKLDVNTFEAVLDDEPLRDLIGKISYVPVADSGFPARFPGEMDVRLAGGGVRRLAVADVRGGVGRPLTAADIQAKFAANAGRVLPKAAVQGLVDAVGRLEDLPSVDRLTALLRSAQP
ncbi:MAG TPA: MmgE/PrpD family protein [Limnochordales bacterium]